MKHAKNVLVVCLSVVLMASCGLNHGQSECKEVLLSDYFSSDTIDDIMPILRCALEECRKHDHAVLRLPEGHFTVKGDFAFERHCFVTNNDEGLKRIAFDLTEFKNLEIKGEGTCLDFVGYIVPFWISKAENIHVSGVSIDYTTPFHSEALITQVTDEYVDVRFDANEFPYRVHCGCLRFDNKPTGSEAFNLMLEFDREKREPAWHAIDYWVDETERCEALPNGDVRILRKNLKANVGNVFVFGCNHRKVPGFVISDSKDVSVCDVNVYHTGGMAFVAQRSENIELNHVMVTCPPGKDRIVSATADATHFSNCSGFVRLVDCVFENQKDDATNIHGVYAMITEVESPNTVVVKYMHEAQFGFHFIRQGMNVEIVDNGSLVTNCVRQVADCEVINKEYERVVFLEALPECVGVEYVVAQTDEYPDVLIKGCTIRNNRARGILLGSRGQIVIDSNYFHVPGAAILLEGDGSYWYEQSGVRDLEIRNNVFENCNYGSPHWGNACIAVGTGIWKDRKVSRYHRNLKIHGNVFRCFDPRILNIYCTENVDFHGNIMENTADYVFDLPDAEPFKCENCDNIIIVE